MTPHPEGVEILTPRAGFLTGRGANFTSQFGEDGLILACLEKFWCANQWCFEVGANDGLFFSNTARLREKGWKTVLIEGYAEYYDKLRRLASETVFTVPRQIGPRCLDRILKECGAPPDMDLGVIDIDGQDYWVWDGLREFRPRLMLIEFAHRSEHRGEEIPEAGGKGQASYKAVLRLGAEKGYLPLAKTCVNLLFCRSELLAS